MQRIIEINKLNRPFNTDPLCFKNAIALNKNTVLAGFRVN